MPHSGFDRKSPPAGLPVRPYDFPTFHRSTPAEGIRLLAMRSNRQPLVSLELMVSGGMRLERAAEAGLATFAASLLDEGTSGRTSPEIATFVEGLGGDLTVGADPDSTYLGLTLLSRHRRVGLELLRDLLQDPSFPEEEIERRRRQRLANLLRRSDQPSVVAAERLSAALYGDGPYGRPQLGTGASIQAIDRSIIERFHREAHAAGELLVVAAGDLDPGEVHNDLADLFAARVAPRTRPAERSAPSLLEGIDIHLVDRPQATQTELRVGHVGIEGTHPDAIAAGVMNSILGGKFSSRINLNLRERHGYTYGASSFFSGRRFPGPFIVGAAVETESVGAAAHEVLGELQRIQNELVTREELEDAQNYLIGSFAYSVQTVEGLGGKLARLALLGLPDDHYRRYPKEIAAVDRAAVRRVARELLHPADLVIVAVGPKEALAPQFEALGRLRIAQTGDRPEDL